MSVRLRCEECGRISFTNIYQLRYGCGPCGKNHLTEAAAREMLAEMERAEAGR